MSNNRNRNRNKNPRQGFQNFKSGECHLLHPSFEILDKNNCNMLYELENKVFYITYGIGHKKELITQSIDTVVEVIQSYFKEQK